MEGSGMQHPRPLPLLRHQGRSPHRGALAGLVGVLLVTAGCTAEQAAAATASATSAPGWLPADQMPTCQQLTATLGPLVSDLVLTPSDGANGVAPDGRVDHPDYYGVSCTWFTKKALSSSVESFKEGGFGLDVRVDLKHPQQEAGLRSIGLVFDDPRAKAIGGFVIAEHDADPGEQIGVAGPVVVVGNVSVGTTSVGLYLQKVESLKAITNDRAIEAAVAVHRSLKR